MKFKNTSKVPDALLREIIRFVCPVSVTKFSIWFKNYRPSVKKAIAFCGCAYSDRRHVVCRIPRFVSLTKPYLTESRKGGYRPWNAYTYEEALIGLVAHELNHLAQFRNPRLYRRTWGARGQCSEIDCDVYALRMIRAWRREKGLLTQAPKTLPKPKNPNPLTPRQRLEEMCEPYGIELDYGSPSPDCIWVAPPDSLCDEDGVMNDDPYESEGHTHFDYHSAKEAIQTYAKICEDRKISLDSINQPTNLPG